jgi:hypothetical protein
VRTSVLNGLVSAPPSAFSVWPSRYLLRVALNAVFPVPKMSQLAAERYVMSFQLVLSCSGKVMLRLGTRSPGPMCCSGKLVWNMS